MENHFPLRGFPLRRIDIIVRQQFRATAGSARFLMQNGGETGTENAQAFVFPGAGLLPIAGYDNPCRGHSHSDLPGNARHGTGELHSSTALARRLSSLAAGAAGGVSCQCSPWM